MRWERVSVAPRQRAVCGRHRPSIVCRHPFRSKVILMLDGEGDSSPGAAAVLLRVDYTKAQVPFERIEVAVAMK
jgi:hypothetical protein